MIRQGIKPPAEATRAMLRGGVSLRAERLTLNGEPILLHLWCIPKGYSAAGRENSPGPFTVPVPRERISQLDTLEPSPFYLDVFTQARGKWVPGPRASFVEERDIHRIETRWLEPAKRRGPILVLEFGVAHWHSWHVFVFASGIRSRPFRQSFFFGSEGGQFEKYTFAGADQRGFVTVAQESGDDTTEPPKVEKIVHTWNGARFVDEKANWFVLGEASSKRADCERWVEKHPDIDAEIIATGSYRGLKPGLFAIVLERRRTRDEGVEAVGRWKTMGIASDLKKAR